MNLYLLSPEIALLVLAALIIVLDLFVEQKKVLAVVAVAGLIVPAGFALSLWGQREVAFGGLLIVDEFGIFFKLMFLSIAALVIIASQDYVSKFRRFQGEYYALVLLASGGMMLMASSGELISIYIALEVNALSLAALTAFLKESRSTEASLKFLILSGISSAVMLYGMALVFGLTGTTSLRDIAQMLPKGGLPGNPALLLGVILMIAGFGFKISTVPFHMWVPDVYEGAPTPVTAYLSVASKAAGFAVILRVFYVAFGGISADWFLLFAILAAISMTLGNLVAIAQGNIKRMLGYSTIAQAGYMMVGLAAIGPQGATLGPGGTLVYLTAYAFTNLGAFFAIIAITNKVGSDQIDDFAGMSKRAPVLALALAFCLVSLTGIPPTAGFWAKVYIFNAAVQSDLVWLALVGVVNSVVSAYYYLRVIKVMYLAPPASEERVPSSGAMRLAILVTTGGVILFGVLPQFLFQAARLAVQNFP